ncbi:hypothetical protein [uncultured Aquimarina sp.]|uniref:Spy/CpxP family protein refolding chaperone n=1 Tax=uncultured Aquimarina sp. TaxID=575652 RepID=UPI00260DA344|nr:hypothetical protein [uncultured Aquimarina sp.]
MKKNNILYILLAFLIVINVVFIFMILQKPQKNRKHPGDFMAQELQFDDAQMEKFEILNENHRKKTRAIHRNIKRLKDQLFSNLSTELVDSSIIDSITDLIGQKEKEKDIATFYHFKAIFTICDQKQKTKFNKIIKGALHKGPRRQHPPKH